jgi:hypothetical protein
VNGRDHVELERAFSLRDPAVPTAVIADIPAGEW